jgi:hypothetical protein
MQHAGRWVATARIPKATEAQNRFCFVACCAPRVTVCLDLSRNLAVGRFLAAGPLRMAKKAMVRSTIDTLITTIGSISIAAARLRLGSALCVCLPCTEVASAEIYKKTRTT